MAFERARDELGTLATGGVIKVVWHVITGRNNEGYITDAAIAGQIAELNKAYSGFYGGVNTGYSFQLVQTNRVNNRSWFVMTPGSKAESQAKNSLAVDPAHRLNIYSCKPGQSLLGWATFPWSYPETDKRHGVVIHYGSVPGGYLSPYNLGGTADHEVGHYLGLYHTFQGGCTAPGDYVADTPDQGSATSGCPIGKDTCPTTGVDPIHNYMDYSYDACYTEFTAGQDTRMDTQVTSYRPSILDAAVAQRLEGTASRPTGSVGASVEFRGGAPNPFSGRTSFRVFLPASEDVSLKIYNVAGQLVATVHEGRLPAGEHSLDFRAGKLSPGMYFAAMKAGGQLYHKSVVLMP
jgi:hypothetical protein